MEKPLFSGNSRDTASSLEWEAAGSDLLADCLVFTVSRVYRRRMGTVRQFYVLDGADWVNVIPLTDDGRVVMVEQYRHGRECVTLEIPGGMIDPDDESPLDAARRELREETGWDARRFLPIGSIDPNPAIQRNVCHSVLALGSWMAGSPRPDDGEALRTRLVPVADIPSLIRSGEISHALVVVAFMHARLRYPELLPDV